MKSAKFHPLKKHTRFVSIISLIILPISASQSEFAKGLIKLVLGTSINLINKKETL